MSRVKITLDPDTPIATRCEAHGLDDAIAVIRHRFAGPTLRLRLAPGSRLEAVAVGSVPGVARIIASAEPAPAGKRRPEREITSDIERLEELLDELLEERRGRLVDDGGARRRARGRAPRSLVGVVRGLRPSQGRRRAGDRHVRQLREEDLMTTRIEIRSVKGNYIGSALADHGIDAR